MLKKLKLGATVIVALFCMVLYGDTTYASSIYDEHYTTTNSVHLGNTAWPGSGGACESVDYTNGWANAMTTALTNGENSNNGAAAAYLASWQEAQENGRWGVSQGYFRYAPSDLSQRTHDYIFVYWTEDTSLGLNWTLAPDTVLSTGNSVKVVVLYTDAAGVYGSSACNPYAFLTGGSGNPATVSTEADGNGDGQHIANSFFVHSDYLNLPIDYEGEQISVPDFSSDDDEDDLVRGYENAQSTSDTKKDTDGDGINDLKESVWYEDRDDVFCGTECVYPSPTKKDVYVEVDWMNDGTSEYKPSNTQAGLVEDAFEDKGIKLHIDIGQFGGGNQIATYEEQLPFMPTIGQIDLYDIKNGDGTLAANFSDDRKDIWRYMLTGNKRDTAGTGAALAGNDDIFIAIGRVKELSPTNQDQAIAGTMIHELGHSLCLSDDLAYSGQDSSCIFAGVDTFASTAYASAMNYNHQLTLVNYSNGLNGIDDHDDWGAILAGMNDFIGKADPTESPFRRGGIEQQPED